MVKKQCTQCKKSFEISKSDDNRGRGKYCSNQCVGKSNKGEGNPAYKHGNAQRKAHSKEYRTLHGIKARCTNPKEQNYKYYGGRGIDYDPRWDENFQNFIDDVGLAPSNKHSIDRIDVDKGYYRENCRWVTHIEQMNNTRGNRLLTLQGRTLTQEQWGRETGIGGTVICKRLKRGWSIEKALTTPLRVRG